MANDNIDDSNQAQVEYWNDQAATKWVREQALLDAQLEPFGRAVLDAVPVEPGQRVLDVGCGCGATTLEIAKRVGPDGTALGVDVSAPMLERAAERARERSVENAQFLRADAAVFRPQDDERFDALVSRFGVMFFADPTAAFTNLRSGLEPHARLSFVCWQAVEKNPWMYVPVLAAAEHVEVSPPSDPHAPGPLAFADADRTRRILSDAGFTDVACDELAIEMEIAGGRSLEETAEFLMNLGPVSRVLNANPDVDRGVILEAVKRAIAAFDTENGVRMASGAWLVTASCG